MHLLGSCFATLNKSPINLETAKTALKDIIGTQKQKPITIERIQRVVADHSIKCRI